MAKQVKPDRAFREYRTVEALGKGIDDWLQKNERAIFNEFENTAIFTAEVSAGEGTQRIGALVKCNVTRVAVLADRVDEVEATDVVVALRRTGRIVVAPIAELTAPINGNLPSAGFVEIYLGRYGFPQFEKPASGLVQKVGQVRYVDKGMYRCIFNLQPGLGPFVP